MYREVDLRLLESCNRELGTGPVGSNWQIFGGKDNGAFMAELKNSTLDDISAVIGFSATVRLAAHYGDRDVYVPREVSDMHPIAKLIGVTCLKRMSSEWSGERISVPGLAFMAVEVRDGILLNMLLHDMPIAYIASVLGMTDRRIRQLRREFVDSGLLPETTIRKHIRKIVGKNRSQKLAQKNAQENSPGKIAQENSGQNLNLNSDTELNS